MLSGWHGRVHCCSEAAFLFSAVLVLPLHLTAQQRHSRSRDTAAAGVAATPVASNDGASNARRFQDYKCFEGQYGSVFTDDTAWARKASTALGEVAPRFAKMFGKPAQRVLLLYPVSRASKDSLIARARRASCTGVQVMAWNPVMDSATFRKRLADHAMARDSLVQGFKKVMPALSEAQLRDSADLQLSDNLGTFWDNVYILTHELGHLWVLSSYSGLMMSYAGRRPGGWLFEAGSILMEDSRLHRQRRRELIRNYRSDQATGQPQRIQPLATFLALPYQAKNTYYAQVRGVVDFLVEQTKDPSIFGVIAASEDYGNFGKWLQANGAQYGLPTTMEGLENAWQAWLARTADNGLGYSS